MKNRTIFIFVILIAMSGLSILYQNNTRFNIAQEMKKYDKIIEEEIPMPSHSKLEDLDRICRSRKHVCEYIKAEIDMEGYSCIRGCDRDYELEISLCQDIKNNWLTFCERFKD